MRRRLQEAAVDLFLEKGFDATTAAEIAARAEVTERTFFRYFPDKRDVLFGDEAELHARVEAMIAAAPARLEPLDVILSVLLSLVPVFEENRPFSLPARSLIARTPALRERQLTKSTSTVPVMVEALYRRGVGREQASVAAVTGMALAVHALQNWFDDPATPLAEQFKRVFETLKGLARC